MRITENLTDYTELEEELRNVLQSNETFQALFPGEVGNVLVQYMAGIAAHNNYRIDASVLNLFTDSVFSQTSAYAIATLLGRAPRTKVGSTVTVQLTINSTLTAAVTLPTYTQFQIGSRIWHTRQEYVIQPSDATKTIQLYQGEILEENFTASGQNFLRLFFGEPFNVDNDILEVRIDNTLWSEVDLTLIDSKATDKVYLRTVDPRGRTAILFGNNITGQAPAAGRNINVKYSITDGKAANSTLTNRSVQLLDSISIGSGNELEVTGITTTSSTGGDDEETIDLIKHTSPRLYAANRRAVRRDDYQAEILKQGGFADAKVWGEYEEALEKGYADNTMMNRAYISVVRDTLDVITENIGTGDNSTVTFGATLNTTDKLVPGTVEITDGSVTFTDVGGVGVLTSPDVLFNALSAGTPGASHAPGSAGNAFDASDATLWDAGVDPEDGVTPVWLSYDMGSGNEIVVKSVRIKAVNEASVDNRAFPSKFLIMGSNEVAPSFATDDDWTVLKGATLVDDPGPLGYGRWIAVDNSVAYRHVAIKILDKYGEGAACKVNEMEVQDDTSVSTVDYTTAAVSVTFASAPTSSEAVTATYTTSDLSDAEIDTLLETINALNHFTTLLVYRSPTARPIDVTANLFITAGRDIVEIREAVSAALTDFFDVKIGSLGREIRLSDIYKVITDVDGVDYVTLLSPTVDIILDNNEYALLSDLTLTSSTTTR